MIPKIIHQVWIGDKPNPYLDFIKTWKDLHPDWEHKIWDGAVTPYGEDLVSKMVSASCKSNVIRLEVVLNYGGVYVDTDFRCLKNIEPLIERSSAFVSKLSGIAATALFGAVKGNAWVQWQYDRLGEYAGKKPPWGPTLMERGCRANRDITYIPENLLYPFKWNEKHRMENPPPEAYAVHYFDMTWKNRLPVS